MDTTRGTPPVAVLPDRFIRHANVVLRIDPITASSSTTDKQDATFCVGF